ncbi:hypothetical protein DYB32_000949 [Aphanomyces invadans]|uniref:Phospholipid/glycerol acyltransferase domain-containing protein n=1 Tax=Aphanomyces invadans TaxID=157072 RepID=A0A3R6YFU5_9STRA|nr:hypothetical protein DYB32_000949 [Aphanomyces invadans]
MQRCKARIGSSKKFKVTNDTLALTTALLATSFAFSSSSLQAREKQFLLALDENVPPTKVDILANVAVQHVAPLSSAMQELLLLRGSPYEFEVPVKDKNRLMHDNFINMMSESWLLCSTTERFAIHKSESRRKRAAFYLRTLGPVFSDLLFISRGGPTHPHILQLNQGSTSSTHLTGVTKRIRSLYATHASWSDSLEGLTSKVRKIFWLLRSEMQMPAIRSLGWLLSKLWRVLFDGVFIDAASIDAIHSLIASVGPNTSLVLAPTHKSHLDYLLVSYICFAYGLPLPRIAAGINLNLPVVGSYLRASGSFFIRRSYHGDTLYKEVGFFHMMASFLSTRPSRDILVVPISIDYDRVLEVPEYAAQLLGKPKQKESIFSLVKSLFSLRRCGNAYVRFASPLPMQHHVEHFGLENLASRVAYGMQSASTITASTLVAAVLLWKRHRTALSFDEVVADVAWLATLLRSHGAIVAPYESTADLVVHALAILEVATSSESRFVYLPNVFDDTRVLTMAFYRNQLLHVLLPMATLATVVSSRVEVGASLLLSAIAADAEKLWASCTRLCPHPSPEDWSVEVGNLVKAMPFVHVHRDRLGVEANRWHASSHVSFLTMLLWPFVCALDNVASAFSISNGVLTEPEIVRLARSHPTEFAEAKSLESIKQALATLVEYGAVARAPFDATNTHKYVYRALVGPIFDATCTFVRQLQRRRRKVWQVAACPAHEPTVNLQAANVWLRLGQHDTRVIFIQ